MEQLELFLYGTHNGCSEKNNPNYFYYLGFQEKSDGAGYAIYNCGKCESTFSCESIKTF